jgi:hypothetical protein
MEQRMRGLVNRIVRAFAAGLLALLVMASTQSGTAGTTPPPACLGDVNGDRFVNSGDLLGIALHFGFSGDPQYDPLYDLNSNTVINSLDLFIAGQAFGPCPITIFLSDLIATGTPVNGWGPFERDTSNGEEPAGDGSTITIEGITYARGLGVHATSDLSFTVPALCHTFVSDAGVDDEVGPLSGSVTFEVWDGTTARLYESPLKTGAEPASPVSVPVDGISTIRLVVLPGASNTFDHADWGGARLDCAGGDFTDPAISNVSAAPTATSATVSWSTDEISKSQIEFGPTDAYGSLTPVGSLFVAGHAVTVHGLAPSTTYHFRVLSSDPWGNVAASSDQTFTTAPSTGLFGEPAPFPAGTSAHSVAIADLNADGDDDVVTANAGANTISALLGNGDGTFAAPQSFATASQPKSVALGLLNNDAFLDAVSANQGNSTVSVFLGNGDGTFDPRTDYAACSGAHEPLVALLNADAYLDIACAGWGASFVGVLLGNGDGTFQPVQSYGAGAAPHSIVAGLFDGDAFLDLATANNGSANVSVLLGNGDGTFQAAVSYAAGSGPHSLRTADLNDDTELDLVVANQSSNTASVLLGNGNGTFDAAVNYATDITPKGVGIADLNADAKPDIITANINNNYPSLINPGGDTVSVLLGNGDGTFQARTDYGVGQAPFAVAFGYLNGDAKLDAVTANWWDNGVTVLLNTGP